MRQGIQAVGLSVVGVVVLAGLSGCTAAPTLDSYLSQEVSWSSCDAELLSPAEMQGEVFTAALDAGEVSCAHVRVPATYAGESTGAEFDLQLMRVGSADADMGTVFINPGGPGGSGVEQVQYSEFPAELLDHYSFIGFDPRGVNFSPFSDGREIRCDDEADLVTYFTGEVSPSTVAEYEENVVMSNEVITACEEANPLWWTLSTANVVQDLEVLRSVVTGDAPLNFIGSSYGTTIAGAYATEFPEHVGKVVLDSPTTVDDDLIASAAEDAAGNEAKLRLYLQGYADYAGISFDEAFARLMEMKQLADEDQLIGFAGIEPNPEYETAMVSSEALFLHGIQSLNYYPEADALEAFNIAMDNLISDRWNATFEWIALDMDGYDADGLEGGTLEDKTIIRSNEYEIMSIVNAMDYSPDELSAEDEDRLEAALVEAAPLWSQLTEDASGFEYDGEEEFLDWASFAREDDSIPDPPTTPVPRSNTSGKQLLIIGSLYESVTPYSFAQDTAELFKSPLITVETGVHAPAAGYNNACINDVLIRYFVSQENIQSVTCPEE
ncbi:pimeloyl-ACP methyl ester carboxylesterase [Aurantimicrobium minutum]|uniref:alpha/beta fold hydrolase n=1 Tax=Aurantimicrobium minutum TaxID=708131 RepID=UPI0024746B40|nr:alpha/beta fold hydrolase [Aurantimicrobium minutum]MDH6532375.1 pimeloyl-ACP methyl ester carboxylesterase [Aurantimicrobium minutum]